ncbi:hypothetical protein HU200_066158 [Digitaria exilis]|uniref:Uncharacterized protein n=1 Tax=Digitaria exilis TaxID=1010633 RepID=A0A835DXA0_9POAL|nr:hypothetical protein HU200_066158 [Digitaria exilis]
MVGTPKLLIGGWVKGWRLEGWVGIVPAVEEAAGRMERVVASRRCSRPSLPPVMDEGRDLFRVRPSSSQLGGRFASFLDPSNPPRNPDESLLAYPSNPSSIMVAREVGRGFWNEPQLAKPFLDDAFVILHLGPCLSMATHDCLLSLRIPSFCMSKGTSPTCQGHTRTGSISGKVVVRVLSLSDGGRWGKLGKPWQRRCRDEGARDGGCGGDDETPAPARNPLLPLAPPAPSPPSSSRALALLHVTPFPFFHYSAFLLALSIIPPSPPLNYRSQRRRGQLPLPPPQPPPCRRLPSTDDHKTIAFHPSSALLNRRNRLRPFSDPADSRQQHGRRPLQFDFLSVAPSVCAALQAWTGSSAVVAHSQAQQAFDGRGGAKGVDPSRRRRQRDGRARSGAALHLNDKIDDVAGVPMAASAPLRLLSQPEPQDRSSPPRVATSPPQASRRPLRLVVLATAAVTRSPAPSVPASGGKVFG